MMKVTLPAVYVHIIHDIVLKIVLSILLNLFGRKNLSEAFSELYSEN